MRPKGFFEKSRSVFFYSRLFKAIVKKIKTEDFVRTLSEEMESKSSKIEHKNGPCLWAIFRRKSKRIEDEISSENGGEKSWREHRMELKKQGENEMAAIEKFKLNTLSGHLKHDFRLNFEELQGIVRFKNEDIDSERTKYNYSIGKNTTYKEAWDYYKQRMNEIYHMKRKDMVVAASWAITLPKSISTIKDPIIRETYTKEFFKASYEYCATVYGEENIISANIHHDEGKWKKTATGEKEFIVGSPHLQVVFIPTTKTKNKGEKFRESSYEYKLNAKECLTQFHLKTWHQNFQKFMDTNYPELNAKVYTGVTGGKNIKVEALKELTEKTGLTLDQVNEMKIERDLLRENLEEANNKIVALEEQVKTLQIEKETTVEWGTNDTWGSSNPWGTVNKNIDEETLW